MFIYLISQSKNRGYDTYDSAVVIAKSEEEARQINPANGKQMEWVDDGGYYSEWCYSPDQVKVTKIGVVTADIYEENKERKVVCASFNAG